MSEIFDVAIVGAGACGLACTAKLRAKRVVIFDSKRGALKLAITGNNRCNITNTLPMEEFIEHLGKNGDFTRDIFKAFFRDDLLEFLNSLGIQTKEENGKVFLFNSTSKELAEKLLIQAKKRHTLKNHERVLEIKRLTDSFKIKTAKGIYKSKIVVLATGGKSYPFTGSDGSGFKLAETLGHSIQNPAPFETPLCAKGYETLKGLSIKDAELTLKVGKKRFKERGNFIFTHFGLSGPAILKLSAFDFKLAQLSIKLLNENEKAFTEKLHLYRGKVKNFLKRKIPERLTLFAPYKENLCVHLTKTQLKEIADFVFRFTITVKKCGFDRAFITKGGVNLREIDPKTLQSKITKNLFFCGEIMDIQGPIGGFNLQFAFSSGFFATESINRLLKE